MNIIQVTECFGGDRRRDTWINLDHIVIARETTTHAGEIHTAVSFVNDRQIDVIGSLEPHFNAGFRGIEMR